MKRKVAVFASGWSNEYLELVIEGMKKRTKEENIDLFVFINYASGEEKHPNNIGARGIFTLPEMEKFDGAVLMTNTFNMEWEKEYLRNEILRCKIPAISFEYKLDGIPFLGTDTYQGIYEIVNHVIEVHHAKTFLYVSGSKENMECKTRRKAMEDAMAKSGFSLEEDNVIYAEWSYQLAYSGILKWIEEHKKLPDAIICANDEMAMGVCAALDYKNIRVPEQVIVTGCDGIREGQYFSPMLSTVQRNWDYLGYEGMELLLGEMNGRMIPMNTWLPSVMEIGESCGCHVVEEKCRRRLESVRSLYRDQKEREMSEWHLRYVDEQISKAIDSRELQTFMRYNYEYNHNFEGNDFFICISQHYFLSEGQEKKYLPGYLEGRVKTYIELQNGKAVPEKTFPVKQLLPDYTEDTQSHTYLFTGLYEEDRCFGYIVQKDCMDRLYEKTLYLWDVRISQDMMKVKQNIRLEELNRKLTEVSITDNLTGLRNRTGFDVKALPYLQQCREEKKNAVMAFVDINRMKIINDQYGHLQGDRALCIVAEAIKQTIPEDWIAVRYGGDEFIIVGSCDEMTEINEKTNQFIDNLEKLKQSNALEFPLTVSLGTVTIHPDAEYSLEEYLRKADEAMYAAKQKYHRNDVKQ